MARQQQQMTWTSQQRCGCQHLALRMLLTSGNTSASFQKGCQQLMLAAFNTAEQLV
jgi:hypothetical protein